MFDEFVLFFYLIAIFLLENNEALASSHIHHALESLGRTGAHLPLQYLSEVHLLRWRHPL